MDAGRRRVGGWKWVGPDDDGLEMPVAGLRVFSLQGRLVHLYWWVQEDMSRINADSARSREFRRLWLMFEDVPEDSHPLYHWPTSDRTNH